MPGADDGRGSGLRLLRFLNEHRLVHTPDNYAFAYRFLVSREEPLRSEAARIVDGGVRITPEQVAELLEGDAAHPASGTDDRTVLGHLMLRLLDLVGDATAATAEMGRDLRVSADGLANPDGAGLRSIIMAMLDRTSRAEARLADLTNEANGLREELEAVRGAASRDRLTGLLNRAALEERLAALAGTGTEYCVAFVDVDRFKAVNDEHGHEVGDRVLRVVAGTLVDMCAPHVVARWGGEEFVVLMEGLHASAAGVLIDRARMALTARRLKVRKDDRPVGTISFSAGVAPSRGCGPMEVIANADALMYLVKRSGRNRVEVFGEISS